MTLPSFWSSLIAWVRGWASGSRRKAAERRSAITRANRALVRSMAEVRAAKAKRDTRRQHHAIERARAARTEALRLEMGR